MCRCAPPRTKGGRRAGDRAPMTGWVAAPAVPPPSARARARAACRPRGRRRMLPPSGTWCRPIRCGSSAPPSAARSARCASAGASLQRSTAAPEALHRSGPLARSGTTRWRTREEQQPHRLTMPRDALPTRLASFCLLAMASPPRDTRRNPLISQSDERNRERGRP